MKLNMFICLVVTALLLYLLVPIIYPYIAGDDDEDSDSTDSSSSA